jgi:iron-sulfur cluster repair protein YtfE (RIC family)
MKITIPVSLEKEHQALHETLARATREPSPIGGAAREVARLLHPHFIKEEEYALPPLGLLADSARGAATQEMQEVLSMSRRLKADLPDMLEEHRQIVGALDKLRTAAREAGRPEYEAFAEALTLHAQTEEQVLYPTAILVGEYLALRLGQSNTPKSASGAEITSPSQ